jgi:aspartate racemase
MTAAVSHAPGRGPGADADIVGVLGGMGPLATIDFMRKVLANTPAASEQDHVPLLVSSLPRIPDRTAAFRGEGASPLEAIVSSGRRLVEGGAGLIVMPCNTAHIWFDGVQAALGLPMIHLADAAMDEVSAVTTEQASIGLLATDATIASGLYVNRAGRAHRRIGWLLPTAREMVESVMPGIAAVKAGDLPEGERLLAGAAQALVQRGATAVVLGCTEIPIVLDAVQIPVPMIDATAALARRAMAWSLERRRATREIKATA